MNENRKEYTFDRFVRRLSLAAALVALYFLLRYLSPVLIPFFVAWVAAYMLFPIVRFLQFRCRLRNRLLCIFLTLALVGGVITALACLIVPPFVEEMGTVKEVAAKYVARQARYQHSLPPEVQEFFQRNFNEDKLRELLNSKDAREALRNAVPKAWSMVWSTAGMIVNMLASLIGLLYFFFLLKDYELYAEGWLRFVPRDKRRTAAMVAGDIERGMNGYFRGQALVALSNCVMFSAGFLLIGFPMPIGLGCFIGLISFVPYLQVAGIVPAAVLALLRAADSGQNFWVLIGLVLLVYIVVQVLQDTIVTPYVMGNITGLSPAIILLSLSVWGYMLGIIGLIIALPATSLMISYYRRFVIGEGVPDTEKAP